MTREFVAEFDPELVVVFAPDHMNMLSRVRAPFTAVLSGRTLAEFGIPEFPLGVRGAVAAELCRRLVERDVDVAVAEDVQVDHGMGLTLVQLFDDPAAVPLLPVVVNAIGFPLPPVRRALAFGTAVGEVLADLPERVLFVGTGGLSHHPPFPPAAPGAVRLTPEQRKDHLATAAGYIDPEWDRELLSHVEQGDPSWLAGLTQAELDTRGCGANEVRVWAAAWAACGSPPASTTDYEPVPEWITGMGVAYGRARAVV
ncbi:3-carboxyethylcatechol 2,3-dioxygenase [Pseudonocardia petroleophila]|uniref:3-carboxyethylcatechol 2,3-dioxygenase n=1 Tax=Pseudonocardia petroleophila TaxID=37331 RepID=A0A7G7MBV8_9PSEU|nr:3-carboxyethylcatechol 2,3-dioxygenase [Pseudonocardia petroleophila]QNG50269.1 3-carboxyethylcatechol 2,3-dioxygenase [Pseudonocardia petroleophila]